jgi:hypothetical protein
LPPSHLQHSNRSTQERQHLCADLFGLILSDLMTRMHIGDGEREKQCRHDDCRENDGCKRHGATLSILRNERVPLA